MKWMRIIMIIIIMASLSACFKNDKHKTSTGGLSLDDVNKIAVINLNQILNQSEVVQKVNQTIETSFKPRHDQLKLEQASLKTAINQLNTEADSIDSNDKALIKSNLLDRHEKLSQKYDALRNDLNTAKSKNVDKLLSKLNVAIADTTEQHQYMLVIKAKSVLYSRGSMNITGEILKKLEQG